MWGGALSSGGKGFSLKAWLKDNPMELAPFPEAPSETNRKNDDTSPHPSREGWVQRLSGAELAPWPWRSLRTRAVWSAMFA